MARSERNLVDLARQSDEGAIETLLARHLTGLRAFVRLRAGGVVRAREDVSDIVQSACREVLRDLPEHRYENELHFKNWLYQAALRKILDKHRYWKAGKRDPGLEASTPLSESERALAGFYGPRFTPSEVAVQREGLLRIEAAFDQLPEDHREVILLSKVVGLPHADVAKSMGRSEGAVRVLLSRALARLSLLLDETNDG